MTKNVSKNEDLEISCNAIISRIASTSEAKTREILFKDFITKVRKVKDEPRNKLLLAAYKHASSKSEKTILDKFEIESPIQKKLAHVAFMTVKQPELLATKVSLNIDPKLKEDGSKNYYPFWEQSLSCCWRDEPLNIVLSHIGKERSVSCANALSALFQQYDVQLCILIGTAGGDKVKLNLGDVLAATMIWDYEGGRLEEKGFSPEPDPSNIMSGLRRLLDQYDPRIFEWHDFFFKQLSILSKYTDIPKIDEDWKPRFKKGVFFVGEKLRVDDPFESLQDNLHRKGFGIEMESYGFAKTCEDNRVPWLMFRGISDYAEPMSKEGKGHASGPKDIWQSTASLAAATAAINFIQNSLRLENDQAF